MLTRLRWQYLALFLIVALAGLSYAWRMTGDGLEPYYAAAVRSMSGSWRDFWYGAFDPAGTISLDKLPGAFWLQALAVRLFGLHVWAIALPQVIEGMLTVVVLYRAVARVAGPVAGTLAALVLALSPSTIAVNRGNVADTLLILLLVLAADATVAAVTSGRLRSLLLAAGWVGLAFQVKMAQAWLVLPALAAAYALAAPGPLRRRLVRLGAAGAVTVAVSLSWAVVVTLIPAGDRPYADGSTHNSVLEQVFGYNAAGRFERRNPLLRLANAQPLSFRTGPGWHRLLSGAYGHGAGWLLPLGLVVAIALVIVRRRQDRHDPVRMGAVLWGGWLVTFAVVFSAAQLIQPYYLATLSPPVAALLGIGAWWAWQAGPAGRVAAGTGGALLLGYQLWLLPESGTGRPGWLTPLGFAVLAVALAAAGLAWRYRGAAAAGFAAVLVIPLAACGSVVGAALGPFDTPFQPASATDYTRNALVRTPDEVRQAMPSLERLRAGATYLMATSNGLLAADFVYVSGDEVLPIGGFTGGYPPPSLDRLRALVASGQLHLVLTLPTDDDPRIAWVRAHCRALPVRSTTNAPVTPRYYYCQPADG